MGYQTSAIVVFTFALTIKKIMSKNTFGRDQNFQKVFKHNQLIFKRKCEQAFDYRRLTKKSTLILEAEKAEIRKNRNKTNKPLRYLLGN